MKRHFILLTIAIFSIGYSFAQPPRLKVALYTPLYLDSAMDAAGNLYSSKTFPRYVTAGLDFYLGAQAALDSLQKRNALLEVFVYDLKGKNNPLRNRNNPDVNLMIGHTTATETKTLAELAASKKTPFISATLPNDAGVYNNPYFVMLNSTLEAHVESIYDFLVKNFGQQKITVFTKAGTQEDQVKKMLQGFGAQAKSKANLRFVDIGNDFTATTLASHFDSTQKNIVLSGSLQQAFSVKLVQQLSTLNKNYPIAVVGMPTWENFNFGKVSPNLEIFYSTPFNYSRNSALEERLTDEYIAKTGSRPGDLFFRGYETMLRFGLLLLDAKGDLASELTRKGNSVITTFDIQPVFKNKNSTLDYFENKHLYFMRLMNGSRNLYQP